MSKVRARIESKIIKKCASYILKVLLLAIYHVRFVWLTKKK